ncbi:hypothetical protein LguiA_018451 [Lonicera macranthoides]
MRHYLSEDIRDSPISTFSHLLRQRGNREMKMRNLPENVQTEIFSRLPVKSLLRFMCLPFIFQIYTLNSNSWREIDVVVPIHIGFNLVPGAYKNGINHWIAFEPQGSVIVSFDFSDEVFRTRRGPDFDSRSFLRHEFTLLNGSFALILFKDAGRPEPSMEIWVTNDDESWTYHSTIGPIKGCYVPSAIWGNIKVFFSNFKREMCLYDHSTRETRIIKSYSGRRYSDVVIYDESLVSIQGVIWSEEEDTTYRAIHLLRAYKGGEWYMGIQG